MKIAIIGAGAMGSLYGGNLSKSGNDVYLVDIWEEHVKKINSEGLKILKDDKEMIVYPKAVTNVESVGIVELAIIFVKSIHTGNAVKNNKAILDKNTMVLSLQNGYGNIEEIEKYVDIKNIIAGTTAHGATMIGPGNIKHAGEGITHIGLVSSRKDNKIEEISNVLNKAGFDTDVSENVKELIWGKLFINVGINALTAILKIKNGQLLEYEESINIMKSAVYEAVDVANASGMDFDFEKNIKNVIDVAEKTAENKSSMLQDVLNKRITEIDTINGAIVVEGKKYGVKTHVNSILLNLIKVIEKNYKN